MGTPAMTVERLLWLVSIIATYAGGNLLLNLPNCDVDNVCQYSEMFDWRLGMGILFLGLFSMILSLQALIARSSKRKTWVSIFIDDRTKEEIIEDAMNASEDDVSSISDGWARLEERHLTKRLEEE